MDVLKQANEIPISEVVSMLTSAGTPKSSGRRSRRSTPRTKKSYTEVILRDVVSSPP